MIYFAVDEPRVDLVTHYLDREWGRPLRDRFRQITYPELFRKRSLPRGAWIFTALDALTDPELWMVHHIQEAARNASLPVFNSAREVMQRYELLQALHKSGRNEFRAYRADQPLDGVRFPVFVRVEKEHDGSLTPLLYNRAALWRAMMYLGLRGLPRRELLVVEFCDTASTDGLYRKYSIFRIGDAYIPRYLHIGGYWMTKSNTRGADENLIAEEMAYLSGNPHKAWAREVFEMAHIEYGRLDYGIRGGRPQAWEINFTPVLAGNPNRPRPTPDEERLNLLMRPAKEHAHAAIREAFERIDPGPIPAGDVRVEFPPALEEEATRARSSVDSMKRRRTWIDRMAAAPGVRAVGPLLRRAL
ncbi:MAG TPA: hypothetical protein VMT15_14025 [Bryobacteraceae bacterium]|nr:hypothetical protein [Bryobacteraceae bacterium]